MRVTWKKTETHGHTSLMNDRVNQGGGTKPFLSEQVRSEIGARWPLGNEWSSRESWTCCPVAGWGAFAEERDVESLNVPSHKMCINLHRKMVTLQGKTWSCLSQ